MQSRNQTFVVGIVANVIAVVLVLLSPSHARRRPECGVASCKFTSLVRSDKQGENELNELILIGTGILIYLLTSQKYRLINNWKKA